MNILEVTSSSIHFSLDFLNSTLNENYSLHCESANITTPSPRSISHHLVHYTIEELTDVRVIGLLPNTYYNCCISNNICESLRTSLEGSVGLSPAEAGALGGFLGALLTVLIALVITGIVVATIVSVKNKR